MKMNTRSPNLVTMALLPLTVWLCAVPSYALAQEQTVCVQCHGSQPGRGGAPVKPWRGSIHAENGISCNDCHGGDPKDAVSAMSPERGFLGVPKETAIPDFCGRCHVGIRDDYLQSAHGRALGKGGPTCATCHGSHDVKKVSLDLINEKSCSRCHSFDRAREIRGAMEQTEGLIVRTDRQIGIFKGEGIDTEAQEKGLFAVRNRYHRLFHEVDTTKVKRESAQIRGEMDKINKELDKITEQQQKRKIAGAFVIGGAFVSALLFYLLRKTYD